MRLLQRSWSWSTRCSIRKLRRSIIICTWTSRRSMRLLGQTIRTERERERNNGWWSNCSVLLAGLELLASPQRRHKGQLRRIILIKWLSIVRYISNYCRMSTCWTLGLSCTALGQLGCHSCDALSMGCASILLSTLRRMTSCVICHHPATCCLWTRSNDSVGLAVCSSARLLKIIFPIYYQPNYI